MDGELDGELDREADRVAALHALRLLDTPPDERFDRITRLTQQVFDVPIVTVTLVDLERQWFKSCIGLDVRETPRGVSLCSLAVRDGELLEIPDLAHDDRFAGTARGGVRFYAGQPVSEPDGHRVGTLCVMDRRPRSLSEPQRARLRDLAAWVELEIAALRTREAAEDAERVRADFVAVVSHELRTPLASVHGALELLGSGRFGELPERAGKLVEIAGRNAERLVRLAGDVLDLSRVRGGQLHIKPADVDLAEVVDHAVQAVAMNAESRGVELVADCPATTVRGDADRLVQVVTNLLANAVVVSPSGARVEVTCDDDGSVAHIRVRDRGPGIPADRLPRIFEPFVHFGPKSAHSGAGLGLAITRGIVDAHGGTVAATSIEGHGSEFVVSLPRGGPDVETPWW